LTEYHKHENSDTYTAHLKQADGSIVAFTNVGGKHLQGLLNKGGVRDKTLHESWVNPQLKRETKGEEGEAATGVRRRETQGPSFQDCVDQGGRITDFHRVSLSFILIQFFYLNLFF
jgi:hypothetical protein